MNEEKQKMSYKIPNKKKEEKSNTFFVDNDKKYTSQLKPVYSFSHSDNDIEVKYLSPDEFLNETYKEAELNAKSMGKPFTKSFEAYKEDVLFRSSIDGIKDVLTGKKTSKYRLPIPYLEYDANGLPIGHEGRNTSQALKELGVKKIPVTIVKRKS